MKKLQLPGINNKSEVLLTIIVLTGVFLRLFRLGHQSMWIDEFITAGFAAGPNLLHVFFDSLANNPHPPLFFMLEHIMAAVFGVSEWSMRLLPAVFGIANIFIIQKMTRTFYSEKVSLLATFMFALNPYEIYYSQEARMYSLFLMTSLMILYYFMLSIKYNNFVMGPFTLWSIIGLYVHNYTVLLLLILNIILFFRLRRELRIPLWITSMLYIFIAWLPLSVFFLKGMAGSGYSHRGAIFTAPFLSLKNYIFGLTIGLDVFTITGLVAACLFFLIGMSTVRVMKEKKITDILSWTALLMVAIPWIESMIKKPVYSDRTLIVAGALAVIIIAIGASHLSRQGLALFVTVITVFYAVSLKNYYFEPQWQKTAYRPQFESISSGWQEGDAIFHTNVNSYASYEFYNKLKMKKGFENRFLNEIPEYTGNKKIRELWRGFRDVLKNSLKVDIYS
ncbi:MAG: glycosyltransferase family 39 protein, partial [Spirochaetia bacterium]|nr:glycosyltransferase family 39 protein [Spirochaetia bacterium]